ncbi:MAG: hypothetical protein Q9162_004494 [Coniocarpon cinnabarinum]
MFDVPDSKRICRADLRSSRSSSPSSSVAQSEDDDDARASALARFREHQQFSFEDPQAAPTRSAPTEHDAVENDEADTYAFKLFAAPATSTEQSNTTHLISLQKPDSQSSGFLRPRRNVSPYFKPSAAGLASLQASTLSYSTLHDLSNQPWPGCDLRWRVTHLSLPRSAQRKNNTHLQTPLSSPDSGDSFTKRCRKGKKSRLKLRLKCRAQVAKREQEDKLREEEKERVADKERHLREKKSKENRRKQLKRREKARVAKEAEEGSKAE